MSPTKMEKVNKTHSFQADAPVIKSKVSKVSNEASEFRKPTMKEINEPFAKLESKGVINNPSYAKKLK